MPDVTSTLLAMYQQVIGGSTSREQSSCEAEAARRMILSGVAIGPVGGITFPLNVVIGTLSVGTLTVTGTFSVPGTLTVGTLAVTGSAGVTGVLTAGTLAVTGAATVTGLVQAQGGLVVTGPASVSGLLTASAGLTVTGAASVSGVLTVNGFGTHSLGIGGGVGTQLVQIANPVAGTTNTAQLTLGNDIGPVGSLQVFSSTFPSVGPNVASGTTLAGNGAGGLSVSAGGSTPVRIYTNNLERARVVATGEVLVNTTANPLGGQFVVATDLSGHQGQTIQNTNVANSGNFVVFLNSAGVSAGNIAQTAATTVVYGTSSDARLKTDRGLATDVSALRAVRVHEFLWTEDGERDRGIFAQEVAPLFPRAVLPGTDARTATGTLARPWMTDYSKFVADLIVGWQQHDATLTRLVRFLEVGPNGEDHVSGRDLVVNRGRLPGDGDGDDPPGDGQPVVREDRRGFTRVHATRIPPA